MGMQPAPPFPQAQQLVGGGVAKETPIAMATGFSCYSIGSLLVRSPSLPQVPLWLLLREEGKRGWGGELPSPKPWRPLSELGEEEGLTPPF